MNNDNNGDNGNHEKKKTVTTIALSLKKRIAKTRIHIKKSRCSKVTGSLDGWTIKCTLRGDLNEEIELAIRGPQGPCRQMGR